jgi:hypothetical protein
MPALLDSLAMSAAEYARRALEAHVTGLQADFYLYGGLSVEHALKARLVRENPAFIAPRDAFLAAVIYSKARDDISLVPLGTPSVGASEALKRVIALDASLGPDLSGAEELFRLRNSEAHLGNADLTVARRTAVSFLRAINALLRVEPDQFWSPHSEFVSAILDETSAEAVRVTTAKIAAARMRYDQRRLVLGEGQAASLDALLEAEVQRQSDEESFIVDCPACGTRALLCGENSLEWEPEYDREGPTGASPWIQFVGHYLACQACGLELLGDQELDHAEVEHEWPNDDADLDAWLADYYQDRYEP